MGEGGHRGNGVSTAECITFRLLSHTITDKYPSVRSVPTPTRRKEDKMEQLKQKCTAVWTKVRGVMSCRAVAAVLMGVVTLSLALGVSVNTRVVTVTDGEDSHVVVTMHSNPAKVLDAAGVVLEEHDEVQVDDVSDTIDVDRAMAVEVQADGLSTMVHLTEGTVADALERAGVSVGKQDTMNCKQSDPITDGMLVQVDRVAYDQYTVTQSIPFRTVTRYTPVLTPGATQVERAGVNGTKTVTYRKTIVNGEVTGSEKIRTQVTKNSVSRKVLRGSAPGTPYSRAPFKVALNSKNQPANYKKKFTGSCTAYATGSVGASGRRLGVGTVAVDPKKIPYGSKLWITSADGKFVYGYAIAADTGSFIKSGKTVADLYMGSYEEACLFGRRKLNVYVIG